MMRVAVIGLGSMGRHHVRVLRELDEVEEVIGVEVSGDARHEVSHRYAISVLPDPEALLDGRRPDAAIVAVPSTRHASAAVPLIEAGIPCLVEKPLASSILELAAITRALSPGGLVAVGHVERFNPAIVELWRRIAMIGTPFMLSTRRVGPYPPGFRDVGVALDLLTHDIDIIRYLSGSEIESVTVQATCLHSHHEEHLVAVGRLANEATVSMEAGWLSPQKIREVRVAGDAGTLVADTLLQDLYLYENSVTDGSWEALATFRGVGEGNVTKFAYPREEPLRVELREFLKAAQGKEGSIVSLDDGVAAVKLALAMRDFGGHAIPSV